jgi:hypothetical protein
MGGGGNYVIISKRKLTIKLKISGICNMGGFLLNRLQTKI